MKDQIRPCELCSFNFVEHKAHKDLGHVFCPDQDLSDGPMEAFDCFSPMDNNLQYLEFLEQKRRT